jgi:hypothetical protein
VSTGDHGPNPECSLESNARWVCVSIPHNTRIQAKHQSIKVFAATEPHGVLQLKRMGVHRTASGGSYHHDVAKASEGGKFRTRVKEPLVVGAKENPRRDKPSGLCAFVASADKGSTAPSSERSMTRAAIARQLRRPLGPSGRHIAVLPVMRPWRALAVGCRRRA